MRLCERVLNTPAKTGNPGSVKPRTYKPFVEFSIELFKQLRTVHAWELIDHDWLERPSARFVVESFPTAAWRTLGLAKLPAKAKTKPERIQHQRRELARISGLALPANPTHDELQATVLLPAGRAIATRDPTGVLFVGVGPMLSAGNPVLEGLITIPRIEVRDG
jgi:hypothetical protein